MRGQTWISRTFPQGSTRILTGPCSTPPERIPLGNASFIAMINYVVRVLQIMSCESDMFKGNLMWGHKSQSWRLVFAMVPGSVDTPPTFYNVTWKKDQYGKWKTLNTPFVHRFLQGSPQPQPNDRVDAHTVA